jgi:hypothetical protein
MDDMAHPHSAEPPRRKPLRLWPGVVAAVLLLLVRFGLPIVLPDATIYGVLGAVVAALAIVVWWLFFSRAPWSERIGAIVLIIVAMLATRLVLHPSIATGMMGMMFPIFGLPFLTLALVAWAVTTRNLTDPVRRATMVVAIVLASAAWTLVRTDGVTGGGNPQLAWRWSKTHEEQLLTMTRNQPAPTPPAAPATAEQPVLTPARTDPSKLPPASAGVKTETSADWPGFRGPMRDAVVGGVQIKTDWSASPPVELWRRPIGPGWSSFAVDGDLIYTQEQRGEHELVACYRLSTGEPVWTHQDATRFWESNAGAGPRGTPTLNNGRVYTFGATGIVNALDAASGAVVWSHNAASDTDTKVPGWGFSSSPLVVDDQVIIAASGKLVAYERESGARRWTASTGGGGYSSPHLVTIGGVPQVLLLSGKGATSFSPADGKQLWQHEWSGSMILQPAVTADGDILMTASDASGGNGTRRLRVTRGTGGWKVEERWTSTGLKPYFNDFVINDGHAFGFDGHILSCIDLADGKRKWKGGRYGHGQLILLPDQDLLLVLSEEGELALVKATPDQHTEVARFKAIEGKTWNHPVLVGDVLLVRNGEEMAAFRLSRASS